MKSEETCRHKALPHPFPPIFIDFFCQKRSFPAKLLKEPFFFASSVDCVFQCIGSTPPIVTTVVNEEFRLGSPNPNTRWWQLKVIFHFHSRKFGWKMKPFPFFDGWRLALYYFGPDWWGKKLRVSSWVGIFIASILGGPPVGWVGSQTPKKARGLDVLIYYWDDRDGSVAENCGNCWVFMAKPNRHPQNKKRALLWFERVRAGTGWDASEICFFWLGSCADHVPIVT